jgi:hypothetical protein
MLGTSNSYVSSTLSEDFQVFFVNYMPDTLVDNLDVNISKSIKLKGNLAFPRKPSPLGGYYGGHPPPPPPAKNGPIFSQPKPWASSDRAQVAKRERRASRR